MGETGHDLDGAVGETDADDEHLGGQVPVGEPTPADRPAARGVDRDRDLADERLESDRVLDRARERARGARADRHTEVLVEDAAELDPGLEDERLPARQPRPVDGTLFGHGVLGALRSRRTVNGPTT